MNKTKLRQTLRKFKLNLKPKVRGIETRRVEDIFFRVPCSFNPRFRLYVAVQFGASEVICQEDVFHISMGVRVCTDASDWYWNFRSDLYD